MPAGRLTQYDRILGNFWPEYDVFDGLTHDFSIDFFRVCQEEAWDLYGRSPLYLPSDNLLHDPNFVFRALMTLDGKPYADRFPIVVPSLDRKVRVYPYWTLRVDDARGLVEELHHRLLELKRNAPEMVEELPCLRDLEQLCRRWNAKNPPYVLGEDQKTSIENIQGQFPAQGGMHDVLCRLLQGLSHRKAKMHVLGEFCGKQEPYEKNKIVLYLENIVEAWEKLALNDDTFSFNDFAREIVAHEMFHFIHFQMIGDTHPDAQRHWFAPDYQTLRSVAQECLAMYFEMFWLCEHRISPELVARLVLLKKNRLDYPAWPYAAIRACRCLIRPSNRSAVFRGTADPKAIFKASLRSWPEAYQMILDGDPLLH